MSKIIKIKGTEAACGTSSGAASTFGEARLVRLINTSGDTNHLVTVEVAGGTDIGTFTLAFGQDAFVEKDPSDKIFAANAAVLGAPVAFTS